ncbi:MAG: glycosyltransferase [Patescibacteria group bacterium]|nr:glycosyltransferase [Patescibacteria group bacterium]
MKVLSLGLDNRILDAGSAVAKRAIFVGERLEKYLIVVPGKNNETQLASKVRSIGISGANKFLAWKNIYNFLNKILKKEKFDLLTVQDTAYLACLGGMIAKRFGLKLEIQVHGFEKNNFLRRYLFKRAIKQADKIRTVSHRLAHQLTEDYKIDKNKIYVLPVFVDRERIVKEKIEIDLKQKYPGHFIFLTVSRLVPVKNIALQIQALAKLPKEEKVKLVIVGDGPQRQELMELAVKLRVKDRIEFALWQENLAGFYQTADCFLLSSDSEGYGVAVAEAVVAGLPVIMTDVGCAGYLTENEKNALIVPVGNLDLLTQAMERVVKDRVLIAKLGANTQFFVQKIASREELREATINNWQSIL